MRPFAGGLGREEGGSGRWRGRSAVGDGFDLGRGVPGRGGALVRPFAGGLGRGKGDAAGGAGARPWVAGSTWAGAVLAVVGHSCGRSPEGSAVGRGTRPVARALGRGWRVRPGPGRSWPWWGTGRPPLQVTGDRAMFGGGSGRIVGDHAGGAPVSGQHHVCGGCASPGEFGGQADAAGMGGDAAVDTCGGGGGDKAAGDRAGGERHHGIARLGLRLGPERAEGRCYTVLHVPEIGRLTGRVRFRGSDADKDAGGRGVGVGDVGPAEGGDFGAAQPGHEKQPGDHGVQSAASGGDGLGLDATPGFSRPVARGKDGRKVVGGKGVGPASAAIGGGAAETCEDAAGRFSGRVRVVG